MKRREFIAATKGRQLIAGFSDRTGTRPIGGVGLSEPGARTSGD